MERTIIKERNFAAEKAMGIATLTVALITVLFCLLECNWLTLLLGSIGVAFSVVIFIKKGENKALAITGIICSTIGLIIGLIVSKDVIVTQQNALLVRYIIQQQIAFFDALSDALRNILI